MIAEPPPLIEPQPSLTRRAVELAPEIVASQGVGTFSKLARARRATIIVPHHLLGARWFGPSLTQFESMLSLPHNWDSYGGLPVSLESVEKAISFLHTFMGSQSITPTVVPLSDGGLQLVWHDNGLDIEATFPVRDDPEIYVRDIDANREYDVDPSVGSSHEDLRQAFQRLSV